MVATVFRVLQDEHYHFLRIAERYYDDWISRIPIQEIVRGVPLSHVWNENWEFEPLYDDIEEHPGGLGDFAQMNKLITATNETSYEFLKTLLGDAEVLTGRLDDHKIWFFNVVRHVNRNEIKHLEEGAVFRINPVGLDILCGPVFKNAVERSGLKGIKLRKVDPDDEYGMV